MLEAGRCQLEAWVQRTPEATELWALPACNPTGHAEFQFGGARVREHGESAFAQHQVQVKTLLRDLETNGWGLGLVIGTTRHLRRESASGWPGDGYLAVPLSASFSDDALLMHVNAGITRRRDLKRNVATWGLGFEMRLREDLHVLPEVFAADRARPFYQLGLRYRVREGLQLDATYGDRAVSDTRERWFSVGLVLVTPPLVP